MERLSQSELEADIAAYDAAVADSESIDPFCSTSAWVLSASEAFFGERRLLCGRSGGAYFVGAIRDLEDGIRVLEPLEASWALASPIVGAHERSQVRAVVDWVFAHDHEWDVLVMAGVYRGSRLEAWLVEELTRRASVRILQSTRRYIVDLSDGVDAFLARRSRNFRKSLRAAERRVHAAGIALEAEHATSASEAASSYERVIEIENRSWKGREEVGIQSGAMYEFYRRMTKRLANAGRHRCFFAKQGDEDCGYVLGAATPAGHYRGLQFSYDAALGEMSLGNWMQLEQMRRLADEGIRRYDLGSHSPSEYKGRWADEIIESQLFVVFSTG